MVEFLAVRYRNFLSAGQTWIEIRFDEAQTTLCLGENGSGKSTMLDALDFVLFNKPYRKIKKEKLVNSTNGRDCLVEVEFATRGDRYLIRRGMKPNVFTIVKNGVPLEANAAIRDQQAYLEEHILKLNVKSFNQLVILGSALYTPFMQLTAAERRALVEDILDIRVFSVMNDVLKARAQKIKEDIRLTEQPVSCTTEAISLVKGSIGALQSQADQEIEKKRLRIVEIDETVNELCADINRRAEQIRTLQETVADEREVIEKANDLQDRMSKIKAKVADVAREIAFYTVNEDCPTCSQTIDPEFRARILGERNRFAEQLQIGLSKLVERHVTVTDRLKEISGVHEAIRAQKQSVAAAQAQQRTLATEANRLQQAVMDRDLTVILEEETKLTRLHQRESELEEDRRILADTKHLQEISSILLKDGGIKSSVVRLFLPHVNRMVNRYLSALNFHVQFTLDETFVETISSRHREEFSYESFSEGEKLRIDLAILFCWRELARLKNSVATDLLVLDEVIDSSLDLTGIDHFMQLLKELAEVSRVFVISHKSDALAERFDRSLKFTKHNGFTRMLVAA